jgi:hypothetical protein
VSAGESGPEPDPAPPNPNACVGFTVYVQTFGPEWRQDARKLREPWRRLGASVPPIEDVLASARSRGSAAPAAVDKPELRLAFDKAERSPDADQARGCANALRVELRRRYQSAEQTTIPARLSPRPKVIEVWLPPKAAQP